MPWPTTRFSSWDHFAREVDRFLLIGGPWGVAYLFRGQADAGWDNLRPSIARLLHGLPVSEVHAAEREALTHFRKQAHRFIKMHTIHQWDNPLDWWSDMQHYRAPTRLLDWTASPYVAAYFAVVESWSTDGVIWFFHPASLRQAMDRMYPIADLWHPDGRLNLNQSHLFDPDVAPHVLEFQNIYDDERVFAQQGRFTMCLQPLVDHAQILEEALAPNPPVALGKLIIPGSLKPEFLRRLLAMNIGANSLFPGMDGIGQSIAELVRLHRVPPPPDPYELISLDGRNDRLGTVAMVAQCLYEGEEVLSHVDVRFTDLPDRLGDPAGLAGWIGPAPDLRATPESRPVEATGDQVHTKPKRVRKRAPSRQRARRSSKAKERDKT